MSKDFKEGALFKVIESWLIRSRDTG
jgi:hypothetical protein